jgi:DNA primase
LIPKETIQDIFETARVEEVVGEFVHLKKRGANYLGNCPFHNEKTPSFTVSPAKGIYKCFGCSAGGNSVNFIMEHEHYTYPEALRYLAKKYNIEVEEEQLSPEMLEAQSERESLYVVKNYAEQHFVDQLHKSQEGKAIGLSYFKERGFTDETIERFRLGYSQDNYDHFSKKAFAQGYKKEYLQAAGLSKEKNEKWYDGYRGRVIFPIHNLSGRPIGFGGRTLKTDKKIPKYINSPQNLIYDKSKVLYGLYFAKKSIVQKDNCYLVEGYTDVISLSQAGVENVVASSGTSLTEDQIRLIERYTPNITILYDGDVAGIKASFRGIDMILKQGMNVKVVLFPEGEDPDSYAKNNSQEKLESFITDNAKDFIVFKTDILLAESQNDPIKKAKLIHEIVDSIALIPDQISRSVYLSECSTLLGIPEKALMAELNKVIRKTANKNSRQQGFDPDPYVVPMEPQMEEKELSSDYGFDQKEKEVVRLLLNYPYNVFHITEQDEEGNDSEPIEINTVSYIIGTLERDEIVLKNKIYQEILNEFGEALENEKELSTTHFMHHPNSEISKAVIDIVTSKHELHNWKEQEIDVVCEDRKLKRAVEGTINSLLVANIEVMRKDNQEQIKASQHNPEKLIELIQKQINLDTLRSMISKAQGRDV